MGYYKDNLSGKRLEACYKLASQRIHQYLNAETQHIISKLNPKDTILELGCGYGRVVFQIDPYVGDITGIDSSPENIKYAKVLSAGMNNCSFLLMDATKTEFPDHTFDLVYCNQNGICAFNCDKELLITEALRVTKPGGKILFSSYSDKFWPHRLDWFIQQSGQGLMGEIDISASRDGFIVCKDGFKAGSMNENQFEEICKKLELDCEITEVDESSVFCEIKKS